jgi:hypothetical protein
MTPRVIPNTLCSVTWAAPARLGYDDERTGTAMDVMQHLPRGRNQVYSPSEKIDRLPRARSSVPKPSA